MRHRFDGFLCERQGCGHPPSWHRLDSSKNISPTDPAAEFRCLGYDCEARGRPVVDGCACPNFVEPPGYAEALLRDAERVSAP